MRETVPGSAAEIIAFVTRAGPVGAEVLVIEHSTAGVGFPAGTLEQGEDPAIAASRGVAEMTGLRDLQLVADLGWARRGPPRRLLHLNLTRRTPMHWWVLVDERGGHCFHCGWLPLADAVRRAPSVMAEWPAEVLDAVVAQPGPIPADLPPLFSDALVAPGAQHVSWQGRWFLQRWLPGADPQPERVQAFAVTATGEAVLVSSSIEGNDWGLPGGGIEPDEGALEALAREIAEEACARLIDADYLGSYEGVVTRSCRASRSDGAASYRTGTPLRCSQPGDTRQPLPSWPPASPPKTVAEPLPVAVRRHLTTPAA